LEEDHTRRAKEVYLHKCFVYTTVHKLPKDARKIKFFDGVGIKSPDAGIRLYRHVPVGERYVKVERKLKNPNTTLNLLVLSMELNTITCWMEQPTQSSSLNFFEEVANAVNFETTRPALEVGDIVVMDNLAVRHYEVGELSCSKSTLLIWGLNYYLPLYTQTSILLNYVLIKLKHS
jgi:hypothetical protein